MRITNVLDLLTWIETPLARELPLLVPKRVYRVEVRVLLLELVAQDPA
jgi:hypothetical protein